MGTRSAAPSTREYKASVWKSSRRSVARTIFWCQRGKPGLLAPSQTPNQYKIYNFSCEKDLRTLQLSVDTPEDLEVFKQILSKMHRPHWEYNLEEILNIYSFIQKK